MKGREVLTILSMLLVMGLFSAPVLYGANLDVCPSGCTYSSIGDAVNAASSGDVVRVAQGRYFENIDISNPLAVTIQGGWDSGFSSRSSDPSLTVVDGLGLGVVFYISANDGENIDVTIEGITITGGYGSSGGGIYASANTSASSASDTTLSLTLRGNIITKNKSYYSGGGIYTYARTDSDTKHSILNLTMEDNMVIQNEAAYMGGGVYIRGYSSPSYSGRSVVRFDLEGNVIDGNSAEYSVGGLYVSLSGVDPGGVSSKMVGNLIGGNRAPYEGGIYIYMGQNNALTLDIKNNVIGGNQAQSWSGGLYIYSYLTSPTVNLINNTITANDGYGLRVISQGSGGNTDDFVLNLKNNIIKDNGAGEEVYLDNYTDGNLTTNASANLLGDVKENDTVFNATGGITGDPLIGDDFHLLAGSPCIDSADAASAPDTDIYGNARVGDPDIGAIEYQGVDHYAMMSSPLSSVEKEYVQIKDPIVSSDPLVARPFAVGDVEGGTLSLKISLPAFSSPVDVYAGIYAPHIDPVNIYQFASDLSLPTLSSGPVKWRNGITAAVDESLYGDIDVTGLPKGKYYLYLMVTPHNTLGIAYYYYKTYFIVD